MNDGTIVKTRFFYLCYCLGALESGIGGQNMEEQPARETTDPEM